MQDISFLPEGSFSGTSCALGLFDGVHKGHRMIIENAVTQAHARGLAPAVFCFKTADITTKGENGRLERLLCERDKLELMAELGVTYYYSPEFSKVKDLSPEEFVRDILAGVLKCRLAVCGTDYTFGKFACGKSADLALLGNKYGIEVVVCGQLQCGDEVISSSRIRQLIHDGEIAKANEMLGYRYGGAMPVEHGAQLGRTWDFPTINQRIPDGFVLPRFGVYCSVVTIDGKKYKGVTNIGVKPSVHKVTPPLAETFIIDFDGNLYGREIDLRLCEFVRPERLFDSFDELKAEIARNTEFTRNYFSERNDINE